MTIKPDPADSGHPLPETAATDKFRSVSLLVVAQVLALSLWFASAAILEELTRSNQLTPFQAAALSSSVQFGFVIGALISAITGIADRFDPRRVFAIFIAIAAAANLVLLIEPGAGIAAGLRFLTGVCLAGVYPVGMKIVVGWGTEDRGWLVGLLVGGLTLGSASPHLLAFLGGAQWQITIIGTSILAVISAVLVMQVNLGPHHARALRFSISAITVVWTDKRIRRAYGGYFGHMWELYAMWAWIGTAATASYAMQLPQPEAESFGKLTAFCVIAGGALLCPIAGIFADRFNQQDNADGGTYPNKVRGKANVAIIAMVVSLISGVLAAVAFGGPVWFFFVVALLWGLSIIPDSALFSALVADFSKPDAAGSIMTLQTAIGFAITILTVQLTPLLANLAGWPTVFLVLAIGPLAGIISMLPLRR